MTETYDKKIVEMLIKIARPAVAGRLTGNIRAEKTIKIDRFNFWSGDQKLLYVTDQNGFHFQ